MNMLRPDGPLGSYADFILWVQSKQPLQVYTMCSLNQNKSFLLKKLIIIAELIVEGLTGQDGLLLYCSAHQHHLIN